MGQLYAEHGMEWNENFGMEYGKCQNGMEDFKNEKEDDLSYFHTNFTIDFVHCSYKKIIYIYLYIYIKFSKGGSGQEYLGHCFTK